MKTRLIRVIMDLEQQTAMVRFERAMRRAGWPARIGALGKTFAAISRGVAADGQVAVDQIDLLPIIVNKRRRREHARREAQQPRAAAGPAALIEPAGEDLLLDAGRIARRRAPAGAHIDGMEFEMRLVDGHWARLLFRESPGSRFQREIP